MKKIKPIKIVYAITALTRGGAERFLVDLLKNLDKEKFDPRVITIVGGGELEEEIRKINIPLKIFYKKTKLGLGVIWQIYKYLKKEKPLIFHSQLFGGDTWGRIAAILVRVPIIITTEQNVNLDEGFFKKLVKRILGWFTNKVVVISSAVKDYSIKKDGIALKKIEIIYNGVEIEKFLWLEPKFFQNDPPLLGVIARLEPQKGHEYLFKALEKIKDTPWKLLVVGDGSLRKGLIELRNKLDLQKRIEFTGVRSDVSEILKQIDVFVLPSVWEGLGIVVLEAALSVRPIIASATGGIPEIIENGRSGWLVKSKDINQLSKSIQEVLSNKEEAQRRALQAQQDVKIKFDIKNIVNQYEKLYENITNK